VSTGTQEKKRVEILPVVFQATGNLRLVRVPVRKTLVHLAENLTEGLDYVFQPAGPGQRAGRLEVDQELLDRDADFFRRNDPKYDEERGPLTLEWLRAHGLYGERFMELPPEPPDPAETLGMIAAAAARGDEEKLAAIYDHEERTFNRPQILEPIKSGLLAIEERRALDSQPVEGADATAAPTPGIRLPEKE
jgi:hypothetical protein